jgi:hypothetical protein
VKGQSGAKRRAELRAFLVAGRAIVNAQNENLFLQNQSLMIMVL